MLARRRVLRGGPGVRHGAAVVALLCRPDDTRGSARRWRAEVEPGGSLPPAGGGTRIGQENDRRLQSLRGMHRHHANPAALNLHVAFYRGVARLNFREECRQRRRIPPRKIERDGHEFVDRVRRLRPKPPEQRAAPAVDAEEPRVKIERRKSAPRARAIAQRARSRPQSADRHALASARRQWARPARGQFKQRLVVEADQRGLEHGGEGEIVVRAQGGAAGRDEIHHGNVIARVRRSAPADGDALAAQGARHRLEQRPALAHQNQDIAGSDAARPTVFRVDHALFRAGRQPIADYAGDAVGERHGGIPPARRVKRHPPVVGIGDFFGRYRRPDFDEAGQPIAKRDMGRWPASPALTPRQTVS